MERTPGYVWVPRYSVAEHLRNRSGLLFEKTSPSARREFDNYRMAAQNWRDPKNPSFRLRPLAIYDSSVETDEFQPLDADYQEFRKLLAPGELALIYEINFRDRCHDESVIAITESQVQGTWRTQGTVPQAAFTYVKTNQPRLKTMMDMNQVSWTIDVDRRMLELMMAPEIKDRFLKIAYLLSQSFDQCFTVGALKGRRYNVLPKMKRTTLRQYGLTQSMIDYVFSSY